MNDTEIKRFDHQKKTKKKSKRHRIVKREHKGEPMTVCIAAIAEANTEYPKIILVADRLVSTWVNYTSGVGKIRPITNNAWVLTATNDALRCNDIITKAIESLKALSELKENKDKKFTVEQIIQILSNEFKNRINFERESVVLSPYNLTYKEFISESGKMSKELVERIDNNLNDFEYQFEAELIVGGIDTKPHIFLINQYGNYVSSDVEGFAVTGSGKATAFPEMTKYTYSPNLPWLTSLVRAYTSKRIAERVSGVGPDTDLILLHMTKDNDVGIWIPDEDTIKLLNKGIDDIKIKEIEIWTDSLKELATKFV